MPHFIEKYLFPKPHVITHEDVEPASGPEDKEQEVKLVMDNLTNAVLQSANRSIAIRERLAQQTIHVLSGERE